MFAASNQLLWSMIGLLLTMGGTFLEAYGVTLPWNWSQHGIQTLSLGVSYQIGAVLLVGCLGGQKCRRALANCLFSHGINFITRIC